MPSSSHTILIAGFQHETNTFAPSKATYENFEHGGAYPSMSRGTDLLALREVNIPTGGFIRVAEAAGHTLVPIIWAGACPSAHVTRDAFECIAGEIVEAARTFNFDAVYLDLHGAMVVEHVAHLHRPASALGSGQNTSRLAEPPEIGRRLSCGWSVTIWPASVRGPLPRRVSSAGRCAYRAPGRSPAGSRQTGSLAE